LPRPSALRYDARIVPTDRVLLVAVTLAAWRRPDPTPSAGAGPSRARSTSDEARSGSAATSTRGSATCGVADHLFARWADAGQHRRRCPC